MRQRCKVTVGEENGRGKLTAFPRWDYTSLEIARGAPGRVRRIGDTVWFELTPENRAYMAAHFGDSPALGHSLQPDRLALADRPGFQTKLPPTELQQEAARLADGKDKFAFFEKPGSGKTKILLDHLVRRWCAGHIDAAIIVAPNFVHVQWVVDEIPKHVHETIPIIASYWRPGKKLLDPKVLEPDPTKLRILTVGFESFVAPKFEQTREQFIANARVACVIDESHRIKTPSSKVSRDMNGMAELFTDRYIASGEPSPLGMQDYYAQYRFLSPRILRCFSYAGFKNTYCVMGGFENRVVVDYKNEAMLHDLAAPYTHVAEPSIEAQQVWHDPWRFDLHPRTREVYNDMRTQMLHELEDGRLASAANQLAALIRLQQIACGRLVLEDGTVEKLPSPRLDVLRELLKGIDGKVVIWNEFLDDLREQQEWLGNKAVVIAGPVSREERLANKAQFLDPSGPQYLLATPGAAGTGMDGLQHVCWHAVFYTQRDNAGLRWQAERRTYRLGSKRDAHYHDIVARATVDVAVQQRNRRKRQNAAMSFNEFRSILEEQYL